MLLKICFVVAASGLITGCASSWIENPSPSTRNTVNDLRLEGFDCKARHSDIECLQIEPLRNKQPAKCDAKHGCIPEPDILVFNRYRIEQQNNGIPSLKHDVVEKIEGKLIGGTKVTADETKLLPTE